MTSTEARDTGQSAANGQQHNIAKDDAHVDMQIGVMHGNTYFYRTKTETPHEQYRVGRNYLGGNAQQQAEKLICQAFMGGHRTTEVAYYWTLAILSGRSFDHLGPKDFNSLSSAFRFAKLHGPDHWSDATTAISRLLACLVEQDSKDEPDAAELGTALEAFDALPSAQQREIRRHLEMILAGGIQDRLDAELASEVRGQRMSGNRAKRAWKFFEPDPVEPRRRRPRPIDVRPVDWLKLIGGVLISGAGMTYLSPLVASDASFSSVLAVLLCGAGCCCAVQQRWEWLRRERLLEARRAERRTIVEDDEWDDHAKEVAAQIRKTVNSEFEYFRPLDWPPRRQWDRHLAGIKNALRRELVDLYGDDTDIEPARWLIRWYARQTHRSWRAGTLASEREDPVVQPSAGPLIAVGVLATMIGAGIALLNTFDANWKVAILAAPAIVAGTCLLYPAVTAIYLEWRRYLQDEVEMAKRYEEQCAAYRTMVDKLKDRPSDTEMARWLDYDKACARMLALQRYQLANRNVIAHAVLSQGTTFCRLARVQYGPPRYSSYQVHVFLLTDRGVRQVTVEVNFLNGLVHNEQRMTFHYQAVTALRVGEIIVRLDGEQPLRLPDRTGQRWLHQLMSRNRESSGVAKPLILSRTFQLSLVNDETIAIRVTNFDDGLVDRMRESAWSMLELALDVAGLSGALRILEAVAAESKEWIARENDRRARRLQTYQDEMGGSKMP